MVYFGFICLQNMKQMHQCFIFGENNLYYPAMHTVLVVQCVSDGGFMNSHTTQCTSGL